MPASPWFATDYAQKTAVAVLCGFFLLAGIAAAWAVSGANLRTLVPLGATPEMDFEVPRRTAEIEMREVRYQGIRLLVPETWRRIDGGPAYLQRASPATFRDPRKPERWLAVARLTSGVNLPPRRRGEVNRYTTKTVADDERYLFHFHDTADSPAKEKVLEQAYGQLLQEITRVVEPVE